MEVGGNDSHKKRCASGVFNSLAIMYTDSRFGLLIDKENPYKICMRHTSDYIKRPCYEEMNTLALYLAQLNFSESLKYILNIKEETYAASAAESLATYAAIKSPKGNIEEYNRSINACKLLTGKVLTACIRGFGAGLVESGTPGQEYKEALAFCQNRNLSEEEKRSCLHRVLFYLLDIHPKDKTVDICNTYVSEPNNQLCLKLN